MISVLIVRVGNNGTENEESDDDNSYETEVDIKSVSKVKIIKLMVRMNIGQMKVLQMKEILTVKVWMLFTNVKLNPLSANPTKWSKILKQFVGC